MYYRTATPLHLDNIWRKRFVPADKATNLPTNMGTVTFAEMRIRRRKDPCYSNRSDWWYGEPPYDARSISTDTGEIVNTNGGLTVTVGLSPGEYDVMGEYTLNDNSVGEFVNGILVIGNGMSQMSYRPIAPLDTV
jgi:hypothetical protein